LEAGYAFGHEDRATDRHLCLERPELAPTFEAAMRRDRNIK
jgi:hypothetical protein